MKNVRTKLAALAVGVACTFGSLAGVSAATMSAPAAQSLAPASPAGIAAGDLTDVKYYPHGGGGHHGHHGGGNWSGHHSGGNWNGGGRRYYAYRGGHHYRHHRGGSYFFFGAPFYGDYGYYGYSPYYSHNSCYRECRYYHGPRYCRYHWRRFCY